MYRHKFFGITLRTWVLIPLKLVFGLGRSRRSRFSLQSAFEGLPLRMAVPVAPSLSLYGDEIR